MTDEQPEWVYDNAARQRVTRALNAIDETHVNKPRCIICDQPANRLDVYRTCSKTSPIHREHRTRMDNQ